MYRLDLFWGGFICGAITVLVTQLIILWNYIVTGLSRTAVVEQLGLVEVPAYLQTLAEQRLRPQKLKEKATGPGTATDSKKPGTGGSPILYEGSLWANLVLQHFFWSIRGSPKLAERFERWIALKTADLSQSLGTVKLRDYNLGVSAPVLTNVAVLESKTSGPITSLTLACDLEYTNGMGVTLDISLPFGYPAGVSLQLKSLKGRCRIVISSGNPSATNPIERDGHWSLSFFECPVMDIAADSTFQGKPVPRITALLLYQIRRSFRRRYVLPAAVPRLILKDRAQLAPVGKPGASLGQRAEDQSDEHKSNSSLGTLTIQLECVNVHVRSGQAVYCTFVNGRGGAAARPRCGASKAEGGTATWLDETVKLQVSSECVEVMVEVWAKHKVIKDVKLGEGLVKIPEIISELSAGYSDAVRKVIPLVESSNKTSRMEFDGERRPLQQMGNDDGNSVSAFANELIAEIERQTDCEGGAAEGGQQSDRERDREKERTSKGKGITRTSLAYTRDYLLANRKSAVEHHPAWVTCVFRFQNRQGSDSEEERPIRISQRTSMDVDGTAALKAASSKASTGANERGRERRRFKWAMEHLLAAVSLSNPVPCQACLRMITSDTAASCSGCGLTVHSLDKCLRLVEGGVCPEERKVHLANEGDLIAKGTEASEDRVDLPPQVLKDQLQVAVDARRALYCMMAGVTQVQQEEIRYQIHKQQKFVRAQTAQEGEHWYQCMQAIQVVLETGEIEKTKIAVSIAFVEQQIGRLSAAALQLARANDTNT